VTVAHTPVLRPVREALHDCALALPEIALVVEETSFPYLLETTADLYIWMGEPPENFNVYPLASEHIIAIVHPDNPADRLETSALRAIFTGQVRNWDGIGGLDHQIEVWDYPDGDEIQQLIDQVVMNGETYSSWAWLAPDPEAMQEAIHENTNAIGFIPQAWLTDQLKILQLSPELQDDLYQPILMLSKQKPQGGVRSLLFCLQNETGQATLAEKYQILADQ
jgi:phosphate transport system substrate-binding protein